MEELDRGAIILDGCSVLYANHGGASSAYVSWPWGNELDLRRTFAERAETTASIASSQLLEDLLDKSTMCDATDNASNEPEGRSRHLGRRKQPNGSR
jgi:hypothetical protein